MAAPHPILPKHASHPHTGGTRRGYIYFNTTDGQIYYDSGWTWVAVGVPGGVNMRRWEIPAATVLTMGGSPVTLLPALPGFVYSPVAWSYVKRAGPAFTVGALQVTLKFGNTALTAAVASLAVGVLDQTTEAATISVHPATAGISTETDATRFGNKAILISSNTGANFTGTGSAITGCLIYRLLPISSASMDLIPATALP